MPKECDAGLTCRPRDEDVGKSGVTSYCMKPTIAKAGERCMVAGYEYTKKKCEDGYVCKSEPLREGMVVNQDKKCFAKTLAFAGEKCHHAVKGFETKKCEAGYECRYKDGEGLNGQSGVASFCLKAKGGQKIANEGDVCYIATKDYERKKCSDMTLECRVQDKDKGKGGVPHYCLKKKTESNTIEVVGKDQVCMRPTSSFTPKKCASGLVCMPKTKDGKITGLDSYCQNIPSSNYSQTYTTVTSTIRIGGKCTAGGKASCPSGHVCKYAYASIKKQNTYCLLPSHFDDPNYTPFVGENNFCTSQKKCTAGYNCVKVYDQTSVCIRNAQ